MVTTPLPIMPPGTMLLLELGWVEVNQHLPAVVVGYKPNGFLLIETPMLHGRPAIQMGDVCLLRYAGQGRLLGFSSRVVEQIDSPVPLSFLSYPESVVERTLRRHERVGVLLPAMAAWIMDDLGSHTQCEGMVLDISEGGCRFRVTDAAPDGLAVRLRLRLPLNLDDTLLLEGRVVRSEPTKHGYDWGIAFDEVSERTGERLREFLARCQAAL